MWSMLRPGLGLLMVLVVGCNDGEAPPLLGADFSASVVDLAGSEGGPVDLLEVDTADVDMFRLACTTECDCPATSNCEAGFCVISSIPLFCCGTPECTSTNACQQSNGVVSQCSNPPDAGVTPDMGAGCSTTACTPGLGSAVFCTLA